MSRPITAWRLADMLARPRWQRNTVLPNYAPPGWWECDVFELTAAGYWREYEVKLTRADFLRDVEKRKPDRWYQDGGKRVEAPGERKHDLLAAGDPRGPVKFWYVTPAGLLKPDELPKWAGLIEAVPHPRTDRWLIETEAKPAPQIHRRRAADAVAGHARGVCYWRYHHLLSKNRKG